MYQKLIDLEKIQADLKRDATSLLIELDLRIVLNLLFEFLVVNCDDDAL